MADNTAITTLMPKDMDDLIIAMVEPDHSPALRRRLAADQPWMPAAGPIQ